MMRITPCRRTTLHLLQILFTDDRTFMLAPDAGRRRSDAGASRHLTSESRHLFISIRYPPSGQIVRGELDQHFVTRKNADEVLAHFS